MKHSPLLQGRDNSGLSRPDDDLRCLCHHCGTALYRQQDINLIQFIALGDRVMLPLSQLLHVTCKDDHCAFTFLEANGTVDSWTPTMRYRLRKLTLLETYGICRINRWMFVNLVHVARICYSEHLYLRPMADTALTIGKNYRQHVNDMLDRMVRL